MRTIAISNLPAQRAGFAQKLYAGFLADSGFHGDALRHYREIAEREPSVNLAAALLADRVKDYDTSRRFAKAAIRYLKPKFLASPTTVQLRVQYAQALVLDEQFDRGLSVVGRRLQADAPTDSVDGDGRITDLSCQESSAHVGRPRVAIAKRAEFIFRGAKNRATKCPLVIEAVVEFVIECAEAESEGLENVRRDLLRGLDPASKHFVEGTVLMIKGDEESARQHLELAAKQSDGNFAGMLNNLAYALGTFGREVSAASALEMSPIGARDNCPGIRVYLKRAARSCCG